MPVVCKVIIERNFTKAKVPWAKIPTKIAKNVYLKISSFSAVQPCISKLRAVPAIVRPQVVSMMIKIIRPTHKKQLILGKDSMTQNDLFGTLRHGVWEAFQWN